MSNFVQRHPYNNNSSGRLDALRVEAEYVVKLPQLFQRPLDHGNYIKIWFWRTAKKGFPFTGLWTISKLTSEGFITYGTVNAESTLRLVGLWSALGNMIYMSYK